MAALNKLEVRGFTKWGLTEGRGSIDGEPHYGSHAWPSMNSSMMIITEDNKATELMNELRKIDKSAPQQGLRAFIWSIEESL